MRLSALNHTNHQVTLRPTQRETRDLYAFRTELAYGYLRRESLRPTDCPCALGSLFDEAGLLGAMSNVYRSGVLLGLSQ